MLPRILGGAYDHDHQIDRGRLRSREDDRCREANDHEDAARKPDDPGVRHGDSPGERGRLRALTLFERAPDVRGVGHETAGGKITRDGREHLVRIGNGDVEKDPVDAEGGRSRHGGQMSDPASPVAASRSREGATPSQKTTRTATASTAASDGATGEGSSTSPSASLNHIVMITER